MCSFQDLTQYDYFRKTMFVLLESRTTVMDSALPVFVFEGDRE